MPRQPTGNPRGRPRGTGTIGEDQARLTVRIPGELYTRFVAFAEGRSFTRGAPQLAVCVRDALDHYLTCQYKRQTGNIPPAGEYIKRQTEKSTAVRDAVGREAAEDTRQTRRMPDAGMQPAEPESIGQPTNGPARRKTTQEQAIADTANNNRQTAILPEPFDRRTFKLGALCKAGHDFHGGQSLIRITSNQCRACEREKAQRRTQTQRPPSA